MVGLLPQELQVIAVLLMMVTFQSVLLSASEQKQNPGLRKGWKRDGRAEEGGDRDKREKGPREKRLRGERRLKKREVEM